MSIPEVAEMEWNAVAKFISTNLKSYSLLFGADSCAKAETRLNTNKAISEKRAILFIWHYSHIDRAGSWNIYDLPQILAIKTAHRSA